MDRNISTYGRSKKVGKALNAFPLSLTTVDGLIGIGLLGEKPIKPLTAV